MNQDERRNKIEAYGQAHAQLVEALQRFPPEMWTFRPAPEDWTIHEIVVHIADSEANSYIRCRRCIAEPGKSVMAYNEVQWAQALYYADQSADEALQLFKWLRLKSYRLIQSLPESVWSHTIEHPENGTMTLDDWLNVYARHVPEHIEQMERTYTAWLKQK